MLYATIVRKKVRDTFERINRGDVAAMVAGLDDPFEYRFHGEHALGGRRTSREAMARWWRRTMRLLPGLRFEVLEVLVQGPPWRTRVATRLRVSGPLPDGTRYENLAFQFLTLRWGRVRSIETIEDLQRLTRALELVAESGVAEAAAEPIEG